MHCEDEERLALQLEQLPDELDESTRLVYIQLGLICRQLAPLRSMAAHLVRKPDAQSE